MLITDGENPNSQYFGGFEVGASCFCPTKRCDLSLGSWPRAFDSWSSISLPSLPLPILSRRVSGCAIHWLQLGDARRRQCFLTLVNASDASNNNASCFGVNDRFKFLALTPPPPVFAVTPNFGETSTCCRNVERVCWGLL